MNQGINNDKAKNWAHMLSQKDDFVRLFEELKLEDYKDIQIVSRKVADNNRLILIVDVMDKEGTTSRMIIDATSGIPLWQQFINVTYEDGRIADIKIILYGLDYGDDFLAGRLFELSTLVRSNNECGVKTYLARGIKSDHNGQKILTTCDIDEKPDNSDIIQNRKLPSKTEIQKLEFWVGYCYPQWNGEIVGLYNNILRGCNPEFALSQDLSARTFWNEDGFYMNLIDEPDSEIIMWIWTHKISSFNAAYPNSTVTLQIEHDHYAISVRILDIPMHELFKMEPSDKWEYGELIYDAELEFCTLANEAIEGYMNETSVKTTTNCEGGKDRNQRIRLTQQGKEAI